MKETTKICLSQNNFDRLLELALNNCQTPHKITRNSLVKLVKPMSFLSINENNCLAGNYFSRDNQKCQPCLAGTYQDKDGQYSCKRCPPGKIQGKTGQTKCEDCPPGAVCYGQRDGLEIEYPDPIKYLNPNYAK